MSGFESYMLNLPISSLDMLYAYYMPFLQGGGVFVPTKKKYPMAAEVSLLIKLWDDQRASPVPARVVWLSSDGGASRDTMAGPTGIGVQFLGAEGERMRARIEKLIAGHKAGDRPTLTM